MSRVMSSPMRMLPDSSFSSPTTPNSLLVRVPLALNASAGLSLRVGNGPSEAHGERNGLGYSSDGELSQDPPLAPWTLDNAGAAVGHGRVSVTVEETV